jgi:hypothetical protein
MTAPDGQRERSETSEATMESDTRTAPEQREQERASTGEEESSGADVEGTAGSSREDRSDDDDDDRGGEDGESESGALQSSHLGAAGAEGEFSADEERAPLFTAEETDRFRERWADLQTGFIDRPRQVVEQADELVSDLMQQITAGFTERRSKLEEQWSEGDQASTEDLRVALTRYRSFFNRLLSA